MNRMWINQPSTHQPLHYMHGTNVLATESDKGNVTIYLLDGDVVSMYVPFITLSYGWRPVS